MRALTGAGALLPQAIFSVSLLFHCVLAHANVTLRVEGASPAQEKNIRAWIGEPANQTDAALRAFLQRAQKEGLLALQALGYYHARLEGSLTQSRRNGPVILLRVTPGKPVRVRHVSVVVSGDAADDGTYKLVRDRLRLKADDVFHHGEWQASKHGIADVLRQHGYFEPDIQTQEARVHLERRTADLDIRLHSGPRYQFGTTHFEGGALSHDLLQGYLPWTTGQPFHAEKVRRLERLLLDTRFFSQVEVSSQPVPEEKRVAVNVQLQSRPRNELSIGPGVATDTGPRLRFGWEKPWLTQSGHALRSSLDLSPVRSQFDSAYTIPLQPALTRSLSFNLGWRDEDIDDHSSERYRTSVQYQRLGPWNWETTYFLRLEDERFDTGNDSGQTTLLLPGTSWARTRRAGGALANWGDRVYLEIQGSEASLGSDLSLLRAQLGLRWLRTLYADTRLQLRLDAGTLLSDAFDDVPTSLRFFAGGDRSIRGFAYQSLGPTDASGEVVGARNLLVSSIELDWPVRPDWRAAIFVDGGSAFDSPSDPYQFGIGGGARWLSPVGPVRLDLAIGVDESDTGFRFHFSLGPDL